MLFLPFPSFPDGTKKRNDRKVRGSLPPLSCESAKIGVMEEISFPPFLFFQRVHEAPFVLAVQADLFLPSSFFPFS